MAAVSSLYITTQRLHYHKLKPDFEDYKWRWVRASYLPSLFVVLEGLAVTERRCLRLYTEAYFPLFLSLALATTCSAKLTCLKISPGSGINTRPEDLNICSRPNANTVSVFSCKFLLSSKSRGHCVMSFYPKIVLNGPMPLLCCSLDLLVGWPSRT